MFGKSAPAVPSAKGISHSAKAEANSSLKFGERSEFNFGLLVLWLVAAFSIVITTFFWWIERNNEATLEEKTKDKTAIVAQVNLPSNLEVEQKALNFKTSVSGLTAAYQQRYSMAAFMPQVYSKINKDVKLNNISVSSDGVNLTGSAPSYKSVAEQVMSLKASTVLSSISLTSAAIVQSDTKKEVSFTISAKINNMPASSAATTATPGGTQ